MAQSYGELQKQAKELGLPYTAVSRKDLEASIAKATGADKPAETPTEPVVPEPTAPEAPTEPTVTEPIQPEPPVEPKTSEQPPVEEPKAKPKSEAKRIKVLEEDELRQTEEREAAAKKAKADAEALLNLPKNYEVEVPEDANTATVYDNRNKVRTYSVELHGKDFAELAKTFLMGHPKYRVEFENKGLGLNCPNCGARITCKDCGQVIS